METGGPGPMWEGSRKDRKLVMSGKQDLDDEMCDCGDRGSHCAARKSLLEVCAQTGQDKPPLADLDLV